MTDCSSDGQISHHLFVIAPNNSGSTFLRRALARAPGAWTLAREGQHVPGFRGPSSRSTGTRLLWASDPARVATFSDALAYDWPRTRRAWHLQAQPSGPDAAVLVVSSPPFLLCVEQLLAHFDNPRFLFLVRDPYAVLEGICRRPAPGLSAVGEDPRTAAARHTVATLRPLAANIAAHSETGIAFTYEQMCADPAGIGSQIDRLVPALGRADLTGPVQVKGLYDESLRDMNDDQIARLTRDDIAVANNGFDGHWELFAQFGYDRRDA